MAPSRDERDHTTPPDRREGQEKKSYHSPEVREFGTIKDLTRTSFPREPSAPDGGSEFPYVYS